MTPSSFDALCSDVRRITSSWAPDPVRTASLERLQQRDPTVLPYFRNLLCDIVLNSRGIERREAQNALLEFFDEHVDI
jgi:hypothetical protein